MHPSSDAKITLSDVHQSTSKIRKVTFLPLLKLLTIWTCNMIDRKWSCLPFRIKWSETVWPRPRISLQMESLWQPICHMHSTGLSYSDDTKTSINQSVTMSRLQQKILWEQNLYQIISHKKTEDYYWRLHFQKKWTTEPGPMLTASFASPSGCRAGPTSLVSHTSAPSLYIAISFWFPLPGAKRIFLTQLLCVGIPLRTKT